MKPKKAVLVKSCPCQWLKHWCDRPIRREPSKPQNARTAVTKRRDKR